MVTITWRLKEFMSEILVQSNSGFGLEIFPRAKPQKGQGRLCSLNCLTLLTIRCNTMFYVKMMPGLSTVTTCWKKHSERRQQQKEWWKRKKPHIVQYATSFLTTLQHPGEIEPNRKTKSSYSLNSTQQLPWPSLCAMWHQPIPHVCSSTLA